MKKKLCFLSIFFIVLNFMFFNYDLQAAAIAYSIQPPLVSARAAVVIDSQTGQVLYNKDIHLKCQPASTTKILTAIVAIEEGKLNDKVTVSRKAAYQEGSSIYLKEGDKISLEDLLYGVLLASGNDASVAVAEYISGSVEDFAKLMNKKAAEIGALNSHFTNPSGLPDINHYSTAYDLAVIMKYAMENKNFARISAARQKTISWEGEDWGRGLRNHNKLLWSYDYITGGKTGYTKAAGRCLVASAECSGREVIAVVLNDPNDWVDIINLIDYGIKHFKKKIVIEKGSRIYSLKWEETLEGKVGLITADPLEIVLPSKGSIKLKREVYLQSGLELPIKKGEIIGEIYFYEDDFLIKKIPLITTGDLNYRSIFVRFWHWIVS